MVTASKIDTAFDVAWELSRGCGGPTGWCLCPVDGSSKLVARALPRKPGGVLRGWSGYALLERSVPGCGKGQSAGRRFPCLRPLGVFERLRRRAGPWWRDPALPPATGGGCWLPARQLTRDRRHAAGSLAYAGNWQQDFLPSRMPSCCRPLQRGIRPGGDGRVDRAGRWTTKSATAIRHRLTGWDLAAPWSAWPRAPSRRSSSPAWRARSVRPHGRSRPASASAGRGIGRGGRGLFLHRHDILARRSRRPARVAFTELDRARHRWDKAFVARLCVQAVTGCRGQRRPRRVGVGPGPALPDRATCTACHTTRRSPGAPSAEQFGRQALGLRKSP